MWPPAASRYRRTPGARGRLGRGVCRLLDYGWNAAFEPAYEYDANGQVTEARRGDGFTERFAYDAALNITFLSDVGTSQTSARATGASPSVARDRVRLGRRPVE